MGRRRYDAALRVHDVELLYDADDWFPDILEELKGATDIRLFLADWALSPSIRLDDATTLEGLIVRVLTAAGTNAVCRCYILWNANITGPAVDLPGIVERFWNRVAAKIGGTTVAEQRLKIVLSANLEYDLGMGLSNLTTAANVKNWGKPGQPTTEAPMADLKDFWTKSFTKTMPKGKKLADYHNLTQFTLGSHHQKTLIALGTRTTGSFMTGWCGMDLAGSVAGGGKTWHDACLRVRGDLAVGLLENFTDRWSFELDRLSDTVHFGVTATDELDADTLYTKVGGHPLASSVTTRRTMPWAINWVSGTWTPYSAIAREFTTEIKTTYESLIDSASSLLFLENQYFRHADIAQRVRSRLDDATGLHVVIVLPAYSEEIGLRGDLPGLRQQYVAETDPAKRAALLAKARTLGLTIDPFNKLTLWMQAKCLEDLVGHARVSIWIPRLDPKSKLARPYVHSKLCVQDTAALFVGSANLNGRSLDGFTDSEINLLLTSPTEVQRIVTARRWALVPTDENDPRYRRWSSADPRPSYYALNNLVRYRPAHLAVDQAFAAFPRGKTAVLDYWDTFTKGASRRVGGWLGGITRSDVADMWDKLDHVYDPENADWGAVLSDYAGHLL